MEFTDYAPMKASLPSLVAQAYSPPLLKSGSFDMAKWLGTDAIRYYSYGRHAMASALRLSGAGPGDRVALPEFICRDLLSSVASVGASSLFYAVDERLNLASPSSCFEGVKAMLAVNYFGFPQDLTSFRKISEQTGAVLIEDNAHGFLSRGADGVPLGRRAPLAVFSLRKTLPIANGAALVANDASFAAQLPDQLPFANGFLPAGLLIKQGFRKMAPVTGIFPCRAMTAVTRFTRKIFAGQAIKPSSPGSETQMPMPVQAHASLRAELMKVNVEAEISRRRNLYLALQEEIFSCGGTPVFNNLSNGIAPYAFPFRAGEVSLEKIRFFLHQVGLECQLWPDLPDAVIRSGKVHYSNVWMVPLLW